MRLSLPLQLYQDQSTQYGEYSYYSNVTTYTGDLVEDRGVLQVEYDTTLKVSGRLLYWPAGCQNVNTAPPVLGAAGRGEPGPQPGCDRRPLRRGPRPALAARQQRHQHARQLGPGWVGG